MSDITISDTEQLPMTLFINLVKYRANATCEDCGIELDFMAKKGDKLKLTVHHIDHNRENNSLANGACLCTVCHGRLHGDPARFIGRSFEGQADAARKGWETRRAVYGPSGRSPQVVPGGDD